MNENMHHIYICAYICYIYIHDIYVLYIVMGRYLSFFRFQYDSDSTMKFPIQIKIQIMEKPFGSMSD